MTGPRADRPHIPGYGIPESTDGILDWSWARERLEAAIVYWIATADAEATPHLIPIWGAWVDDRWYVEGGPTRWQRNLRANPRMAVKVESGRELVIVEGTARELIAPPEPLASRILAGYAKYRAAEGYEASESNWAAGGLWELTPIKAFAWSEFPANITRFRFEAD
jgi:Pyridoxamine 5'-phosphate oxidase